MNQLSFDSLKTDPLHEIVSETSAAFTQIHKKKDHELLEILGVEVGRSRGSIHELLKTLADHDPRIEVLSELMKRYQKTPLPRGKAFGCPHDIFLHYQHMRELKQEHFIVLLLDNKHRIQEEILVAIGTLNRCTVGPREVFAEAIKQRAAAIVCLHNHPTADVSASSADIELTRRLKEAGNLVGIKILDHLIIGDGTYYSFADQGFI